jgi:hypothetical protein
MAVTDATPASYADIEALPANMVGQILFGVLHAHPRPAFPHGFAANSLSAEITSPFGFGRGGPGGWVFAVEPELHLDDHVIVPDLAGWRRERMPEVPNVTRVTLAPDWVCEVLSPSTMRIDRTDKLQIYAEFAVGHAWYVNPDARTLEVFENDNGTWKIAATFKDADPVTAPPFEAHTFALNILWEL